MQELATPRRGEPLLRAAGPDQAVQTLLQKVAGPPPARRHEHRRALRPPKQLHKKAGQQVRQRQTIELPQAKSGRENSKYADQEHSLFQIWRRLPKLLQHDTMSSL